MRWITKVCLKICLLSYSIAPTLADLPISQSSLTDNDLSSSNWCGTIQSTDESAPFTSVSSTIIVPTVTGPRDAAYSAYAWLGIDGWGNLDNLFQAGLDIRGLEAQDGSYLPQFRGYYEWYPEDAQFFTTDELPLSSGDALYINITATSTTTGTIYLENRNNGKSQSFSFDEPNYPLTGKYAEWIVEEFSEHRVPFFGSINFASPLATTSEGNSFDISSASLIQADSGLTSALNGTTVSVSAVDLVFTTCFNSL